MAKSTPTIETVTCKAYAKYAGLDYDLLRAVAISGKIPLAPVRSTTTDPLLPRDISLSEEQLVALAREAYAEALKAYSHTARKMRAILNDVVAETDELIIDGIDPVTEVGGLMGTIMPNRQERWPFDQMRTDLNMIWFDVCRLQQALWHYDSQTRLVTAAAEWTPDRGETLDPPHTPGA